MCTVTLHRSAGSFLLTMNRDEARARAPEIPPAVSPLTGALDWLAPRDSERGGTWIGVNSLGVAVCIMNGNVPLTETLQKMASGAPSRGRLPEQALTSGSLDAVLQWMRHELDPTPYPAFMALVAGREEAVLFTFDGYRQMDERALPLGWAMIASSQIHTEETLRRREEAFQQWQRGGEVFSNHLPAFHLFTQPGEEYWTPLMSRDISCTRSITQVEVTSREAVMRYGPVASGKVEVGEWRLPLSNSALSRPECRLP